MAHCNTVCRLWQTVMFLWDFLMRFHAFWPLWDFLMRFHAFGILSRTRLFQNSRGCWGWRRGGDLKACIREWVREKGRGGWWRICWEWATQLCFHAFLMIYHSFWPPMTFPCEISGFLAAYFSYETSLWDFMFLCRCTISLWELMLFSCIIILCDFMLFGRYEIS